MCSRNLYVTDFAVSLVVFIDIFTECDFRVVHRIRVMTSLQAPMFKLYTDYCDKFDDALRVLKEAEKRKDFSTFIAVCSSVCVSAFSFCT